MLHGNGRSTLHAQICNVTYCNVTCMYFVGMSCHVMECDSNVMLHGCNVTWMVRYMFKYVMLHGMYVTCWNVGMLHVMSCYMDVCYILIDYMEGICYKQDRFMVVIGGTHAMYFET